MGDKELGTGGIGEFSEEYQSDSGIDYLNIISQKYTPYNVHVVNAI